MAAAAPVAVVQWPAPGLLYSTALHTQGVIPGHIQGPMLHCRYYLHSNDGTTALLLVLLAAAAPAAVVQWLAPTPLHRTPRGHHHPRCWPPPPPG